jgi:hypothetical protein
MEKGLAPAAGPTRMVDPFLNSQFYLLNSTAGLI